MSTCQSPDTVCTSPCRSTQTPSVLNKSASVTTRRPASRSTAQLPRIVVWHVLAPQGLVSVWRGSRVHVRAPASSVVVSRPRLGPAVLSWTGAGGDSWVHPMDPAISRCSSGVFGGAGGAGFRNAWLHRCSSGVFGGAGGVGFRNAWSRRCWVRVCLGLSSSQATSASTNRTWPRLIVRRLFPGPTAVTTLPRTRVTTYL